MSTTWRAGNQDRYGRYSRDHTFSRFKVDQDGMMNAIGKPVELRHSEPPPPLSLAATPRCLAWIHKAELYDMAANFGVAATPDAFFPEDIERAINKVLLNDTREMCGTMSLVASRFRTCFIRILVLDLDLPFTEGRGRSHLPEEELLLIRRVLEASGRIRHLAVTWNIWAHLPRECGALWLSGLYLIWHRGFHIYTTCSILLHSGTLPSTHLPISTTRCHLERLANTSSRQGGKHFDLQGAMLVLVGRTELHEQTATKIQMISDRYPKFSAVLVEWVAKMEGQESLGSCSGNRCAG
ncbi:hypothetical protein FB451DRAFT_1173199 [Mycena latifolia]|nr:hypothetical protein FB451DRAFT_1173199 [Mycena latifolia]